MTTKINRGNAETRSKPSDGGASVPASLVNQSVAASRSLPKNIFQHAGYYRVRIQRHGVRYETDCATLARAIVLRDRFLALAGALAARSNTGLSGISESDHWTHNRRYPAFHVSHGSDPRRRFTWGVCGRTRRQALRAAAAHRSRLTGETFTPQQIKEALSHV
jgi:hypothetical protein